MGKASKGIPAACRGARTRRRKYSGQSSTGKSKGLLPLPRERAMARNARSYKSVDYPSWCAKMDTKKGNAHGVRAG